MGPCRTSSGPDAFRPVSRRPCQMRKRPIRLFRARALPGHRRALSGGGGTVLNSSRAFPDSGLRQRNHLRLLHTGGSPVHQRFDGPNAAVDVLHGGEAFSGAAGRGYPMGGFPAGPLHAQGFPPPSLFPQSCPSTSPMGSVITSPAFRSCATADLLMRTSRSPR